MSVSNSDVIILNDFFKDDVLEKSFAFSLKSIQGARCKRFPVNMGDSERTHYRRKKAKKAMLDSEEGSVDIRRFMGLVEKADIANSK